MSAAPSHHPVLIFDGDCGFCTTSAMWFERRAGEGFEIAPWQSLDLDTFGLTERDVTTAAYWVDADGSTHRGHLAAAAALRGLGRPWSPLGRLLALPPISWLAAIAYRLLARYRYRLPGSTDACRLPQS